MVTCIWSLQQKVWELEFNFGVTLKKKRSLFSQKCSIIILKKKICAVEKGLPMKIFIRSKRIFKDLQNHSHILDLILAGDVPERKRRLRCGWLFLKQR